MPERVHLTLGSNLGSRRKNLLRALRLVGELPGTRVLRVSSFYDNPSVGAPGPDYLNAAALVETRLRPLSLLVELKRIEAVLGRRPGRRWGPRPADLDIAVWGRRRVRSRLLTLPHPRARRRRFVLEPLAELGLKLAPL